MDILTGYKTFFAAAGLVGLALYQASTHDFASAWQSLMAALAAFGLKMAVERQK